MKGGEKVPAKALAKNDSWSFTHSSPSMTQQPDFPYSQKETSRHLIENQPAIAKKKTHHPLCSTKKTDRTSPYLEQPDPVLTWTAPIHVLHKRDRPTPIPVRSTIFSEFEDPYMFPYSIFCSHTVDSRPRATSTATFHSKTILPWEMKETRKGTAQKKGKPFLSWDSFSFLTSIRSGKAKENTL